MVKPKIQNQETNVRESTGPYTIHKATTRACSLWEQSACVSWL